MSDNIINNGKYTGLTEQRQTEIQSGGTKISSAILHVNPELYAINASEINWEGYKFGDNELSYTGYLLSYLNKELNSKATVSDWSNTLNETELKNKIILFNSYDYNNVSPETDIFDNENKIEDVNYFETSDTTTNKGWVTSINPNDEKYIWLSTVSRVSELSNDFKYWEGPMSEPILLTGEQGKPASYWHIRYTTPDNINDTPHEPSSKNISNPNYVDSGDHWSTTLSFTPNKRTWTTSILVNYIKNQYTNLWEESLTNSTWTTPIPMNGIDGITPSPIQTVLKYRWLSSTDYPRNYNNWNNTPSSVFDYADSNLTNWKESPGNGDPSSSYLWMTQGQRQNSSMVQWYNDNDINDAYWSTPICLSGAEGRPGEDGKNIEFIYKNSENQLYFIANDNNDNNNPANWEIEEDIDNYLGPDGYKWNNNPKGVSSSKPYEYCSIRYKTNGSWGAFIKPFLWSKYGENGLDGDGIEYIYAVTPYDDNNPPNPPKIDNNQTSFDEYQNQNDWGVDNTNWFDEPQEVNNYSQYYQWVSIREYKYLTHKDWNYFANNICKRQGFNTSLAQSLKDGDKIPNLNLSNDEFNTCKNAIESWLINNVYYSNQPNWYYGFLASEIFNNINKNDKKYWSFYSIPKLWNWYVNDGTNADRIVMLYKRNSSINSSPNVPDNDNSNQYTIAKYSYLGWAESPGNKTDYSNNDKTSYAYLWMTSNYYSEKTTSGNDTIYTLTDEWSTPVCLTGETGQEGEDGADIEFIYFRTADDNNSDITVPTTDNNFQNNDWPFVGEVNNDYYIIDGVKTLLNQDHDTWSDNPLGVTSTYDYEYASVRRKPAGNDSQWGDFCKPFLWSKYGEDGVDGDGVEYIFYCPQSTTLIDWTDNNNNAKNPSLWDATTSEFQASEYYISSWNDDPQEVGENNKYEYVSQRKKRKITDNNKTDFIVDWPQENSTYTVGSGNNAITYKVGDMVWFPYSTPALWANYAKDGLATNLVLESDNDNITVGITSEGLVNNNYSDTVNFMLVYNTVPLDINTHYTLSLGNIPNDSKFSATLTGNTLSISIAEGFDLSEYDYILPITVTATISNNPPTGLDSGTPAVFTLKITGIELTINDIYKLNIDKQVIKLNPNNEQYDTVNISLKSLTSNNSITTQQDAKAKHLYIRYNVDNINIDPNGFLINVDDDCISVGQYNPSIYYNKHTFRLYYILDDSFFDDPRFSGKLKDTLLNNHNAVLLDTETITAVYDGANGNPGTDSKSQEYIYYRTNTLNPNWSNITFGNPSSWKTNSNYNIDDFPFVGNKINSGNATLGSSYYNINGIKSLANQNHDTWTDNPCGVSDLYNYEFTSTRSFDTSTKQWGPFSNPVPWSTWGHDGIDGDGVEYIFAVYNNIKNWNNSTNYDENNDPRTWWSDTSNSQYQTTPEYISPYGNNWNDNPLTNLAEGQYQYVSIRKYRTFTQEDYNILKNWYCYQDSNNSNIIGLWSARGAGIEIDPSTFDDIFTKYIGKKIWLPYSEPTLWSSNIPGKNGQFRSTVFNRSNTTPSKPTGGYYNNPIPNTSGWSDGIPAGSDPLWSSYAIFTNAHINTSPTWSTPILEQDTDNIDIEFSPYSNSSNNGPSAEPSNTDTSSGNRHNASAANQKWFDPKLDNNIKTGVENVNGTKPTWSDMVWRAERKRINYTANESNNWSNWVISRIKGEKGDSGDNGNDAYTIDWTNDQINLAVDDNGKIKRNQYKYSKIIVKKGNYTYPDNCVRVNWSGYSSHDSGYNVFTPYFTFTNRDSTKTQYYIDVDTNNIYVKSKSVTTGNIATSDKILIAHNIHSTWLNANILENNLPEANLTSQNTSLYPYVFIVVGSYNSNQIINGVTLPENGTEFTFTIQIRESEQSSNWIDIVTDKKLRICGQHNGQDGENAVTYEIIPTVNSVYYDGTNYNPNRISYIVNKYDGTSISQLTNFPSLLCAEWTRPNGTKISNNLNLNLTVNENLSYINLNLLYDNKIIDKETIPIVHKGDDGEQGAQGFTGPVVRYCGEYDSSKVYLTGKYYTGSSSNYQYNGTDILYKDIVYYTTNKKYYTPNQIGTTNYYSNANSTTGGCKGAGYLPANSAFNSTNWTVATQFDFVATKLLYADQALIKQITSHDFIATKTDGTPVAGVTSGAKQYENSEVTDNNYSGLHSLTFNKDLDTGGAGEDPSNVRIFAGKIWETKNNTTSYSLTYAPFNVRQDGTAYMSKANIVGDVNIGGTVSIGENVNIAGNVTIGGASVKISGDISARSLALNNSFYYNENRQLPVFDETEHMVIYQMFYNAQNSGVSPQIIPDNTAYLWMTTKDNNNKVLYTTDTPGTGITVEDNALYIMYSAHGTKPNTNINQKFWLVTKTDLFVKPSDSQVILTTTKSIHYGIDTVNYNYKITEINIRNLNSRSHYPEIIVQFELYIPTNESAGSNITYQYISDISVGQAIYVELADADNGNYVYHMPFFLDPSAFTKTSITNGWTTINVKYKTNKETLGSLVEHQNGWWLRIKDTSIYVTGTDSKTWDTNSPDFSTILQKIFIPSDWQESSSLCSVTLTVQ